MSWTPGRGKRREFRLLGRIGRNLPGLRLADFRHQQGIYILYGNHGPHYVGLTTDQGLGKRLKDHRSDRHARRWDRFSWFGFRQALQAADQEGLCKLGELATHALGDPTTVIKDTEALLIKAMGLTNKNQMTFHAAEEWLQVRLHEVDALMDKLA